MTKVIAPGLQESTSYIASVRLPLTSRQGYGETMILLIEDDSEIRELYAEILGGAGYATQQARNRRVALEQLALLAEVPCLVLLDMMMPEMTGAELLDVLHYAHKLAAMPVVLISASTISTRESRGARRFVKKPVSIETLMQILEEFCGLPSHAEPGEKIATVK